MLYNTNTSELYILVQFVEISENVHVCIKRVLIIIIITQFQIKASG